MSAFFSYFGRTGLKPTTLMPAYGLAEFTLCATAQVHTHTNAHIQKTHTHNASRPGCVSSMGVPGLSPMPLPVFLVCTQVAGVPFPVLHVDGRVLRRDGVVKALPLPLPQQPADAEGGVTYVSVGSGQGDTVIRIVDPHTRIAQVRHDRAYACPYGPTYTIMCVYIRVWSHPRVKRCAGVMGVAGRGSCGRDMARRLMQGKAHMMPDAFDLPGASPPLTRG
jgi:hypothetical protein